MKFKEYFQLICEVTVDQVKTRFESKAWKRAIETLFKYLSYQKDIDDLDDTVRAALEYDFLPQDVDDNSKGNALNWLVNTFIKDPTIVSKYHRSANQIRQNLELFYQIKQLKPNLLVVKAIEGINDFSNLQDIVQQAKPAYDEYLRQRAEKDTKTDINASRVLETAEWNVYIPKTKGAAIQLGKGTDWCTAAPGLNYYEHYVKTSPLVIFLNKQDPEIKYQFWYNGTESQFMNPRDEDILYSEESETFYKLNELVKQFVNIHPKLEESNKYKYKLLENGGYMIQTPNATMYYDDNGDFHRENGPARIISGSNNHQNITEHYIHGKLHREDGPARILERNPMNQSSKVVEQSWYQNGVRYREGDKPDKVIEDTHSNEYTEYYHDTNGKFHRETGPATISYRNGKVIHMEWHKHGQSHRLDGPAVIYSDTNLHYYFINDIQFTKEEFYDEKARERKLHNYIE